MRHHRSGYKLGRDSAHREALLMNQAASLILHGRIKTTVIKAKALRPYVEKLVTTARNDTLTNRRTVYAKLHVNDKASSRAIGEKTVVQKLFEDVAPRFKDRPGGYTRIVKIGHRPGDAAEMAYIEFVDHVPQPKVHHHHHNHAHTHDHEHAAAAGA